MFLWQIQLMCMVNFSEFNLFIDLGLQMIAS